MPTSKTKVTLGDCAFSCAAPKIWNNLPLSIRKSQSIISFKTELKTHLFVQAFPHTYTTAKKKRPNQLGYLVGIWL